MTTGASNDIERATELARNMVTRWGLSEKLGPLMYTEEEGEVFLGRSVTQHKQMSDETAHVIDEEIRRFIDRNYDRAAQILNDNMEKLHTMADALIRYETIDADQISDIMEGRDVRPPKTYSNDDRDDSSDGAASVEDDDADEPSGEVGPASSSLVRSRISRAK